MLTLLKSHLFCCGSVFFNSQQECIPVGCVPAARRPYAGGVGSAPGVGGRGGWLGVCSGGGCLVRGGGVPGLGRGVSAARGSAPGDCLVWMGCLPQCLVRYQHHPSPL